MPDVGCNAIKHGDRNAYQVNKCRCESARNEERIYRKRKRENRYTSPLVSSIGSMRRVRALNYMGWPGYIIAEEALGRRNLRGALISAMGGTVKRYTHDAIAAFYESHCMIMGPSSNARVTARKRGYAPPLAWDNIDDPKEKPSAAYTVRVNGDLDEAAVIRALSGDVPTKLTNREIAEVIRRDPDTPPIALSERTGIAVDTIQKHRRGIR